MWVCPRCGDQYQDTDLRTICPRCLVALEQRQDTIGERAPEAPPARATTADAARAEPPKRALAAGRAGRGQRPRAPRGSRRAGSVRVGERYSAPSAMGCGMLTAVLAVLAVWSTLGLGSGASRLALLGAGVLWVALLWASQMWAHRMTSGWKALCFPLLVLAVWGTHRLLWTRPDHWALLGTLGLWMTMALAAHSWLYRSHIRVLQLILPPHIGLGSEVPYQLALTPGCRLPVHGATLLLRAEERSEWGNADRDESTREVFRTEVEICRRLELAPNRETVLSGTFTLPRSAPPTFQGRHNKVEWVGRLWVGIDGWRPDSWHLLDPCLTVRPIVPSSAKQSAVSEPTEIPLSAFEGCSARLAMNAPLDGQGRVHLRAGESVEGRLRMRQPADRPPCRRVVLETRFAVTGRHLNEGRSGGVTTLWEAGAEGDREIDVPVQLQIPSRGPITYRGEMFSIDWTAELRAEGQTWVLTATIPMVVEPGAGTLSYDL